MPVQRRNARRSAVAAGKRKPNSKQQWARTAKPTSPPEVVRSTNTETVQDDEDLWLRYSEAARLLGVKKGTLEVWLSTGRHGIPHYKISNRVLFRRSELLAWLRMRRRGDEVGTAA